MLYGFWLVAIGASTGGPAVLSRVLSRLPATFPASILVVQHIARGFSIGFAEWLDSVTPLHVKLARDGEELRPRTVYIAPDDRHLGLVDKSTIELSNSPPMGTFRPSATYLYESVLRAVGPRMIAVILTGMGRDGVLGLARVHQAGGHVIAQNEDSCTVFGMPKAAIDAGTTHQVLAIDDIARELMRRT